MAVELDYFVVDVFTHSALQGNPLAVVLDSVGLPTERMQAVAREFNLSETTFVRRRSAEIEQTEGVCVRIFTTQEELPFAGHPTLGTASVLKTLAPAAIRDNILTLALKVDPVPVRFDATLDGPASVFGEMTQRDPEFGAELKPDKVALLLGLQPDDLDPTLQPQIVSTGNAFVIVVLRSEDALARVSVKHAEATPWLRERAGRWFYILAPTGSQEPLFRARMQFYGGEDPATGSAAGCAIGYLVARGVVASEQRILVQQGVEVGRPSNLLLSAKSIEGRITDVRVAGSTVLVAKGRLFLP